MILDSHIYLSKGVKYYLRRMYRQDVGFAPPQDIITEYISFGMDRVLQLNRGYPYDGPSGPTIDTWDSLLPTVEHDAFYQLIRRGKLPTSYRKKADNRLYIANRACGMNWVRAKAWTWAVKRFARRHAIPGRERKIYEAPGGRVVSRVELEAMPL